MKGEIQPDHIPVNKFQLKVVGLIDLTCTEVGGFDDEIETIILPDRTVASGGNRGPTEFPIKIPAHHIVQQAAMEVWFKEGQDPISPTYKKPCTLIMTSLSGKGSRNFTLVGVFPKKRTTPDLEMKAEGDMAEIEWMMSADDVFPV